MPHASQVPAGAHFTCASNRRSTCGIRDIPGFLFSDATPSSPFLRVLQQLIRPSFLDSLGTSLFLQAALQEARTNTTRPPIT